LIYKILKKNGEAESRKVEAKLNHFFTMLQITKQQVAGASSCSAVEQKPFEKRVSPKNQKSRANNILKIF